MSLRSKVIKLAYQHEHLRPYLLPLIEKHAAGMAGLVSDLKKLQGVEDCRIISDKRTPYGGREIVLGVYMDAEIGATKGRQHLTGLVRKELDRVVSQHPVEMVRMLPPRPGLDPFGRPGENWDTHRDKFRKYYSEHPYRLILEKNASTAGARE